MILNDNKLIGTWDLADVSALAPWLNDSLALCVMRELVDRYTPTVGMSNAVIQNMAERMFPGSTRTLQNHFVWLNMAPTGIPRLCQYETAEQLTAALRNQAIPLEPGDMRDYRDWPEFMLLPESIRTPKTRLQFAEVTERQSSSFYDLRIQVSGIPGLHEINAVLWVPMDHPGICIGLNTDLLASEFNQYRCVVACDNASGERDLTFVIVQATEEHYDAGLHYEAASEWATNEGHVPKHVFDENDPGGRALLDKFEWMSASKVTVG